jgi:hypothetical protein
MQRPASPILLFLFLIFSACSTNQTGSPKDVAGSDAGVILDKDGRQQGDATPTGDGKGDGQAGDDGVGTDVPPLCEEGERVCTSEKEVAECQAGQWIVVTVCMDTHVCAGGTCVKLENCEPGTIDGCYSLDAYSQCNTTGTAWEPVKCPEGEKCANGICGVFECMPGQAICVDSSSKSSCLPDGSGYGDPEPCPAGLTCVGGKCMSECLTDPKWANSYIGCEYWTIDMDNYHDPMTGVPPDEAIHGVILSNPGTAKATVTFTSFASDVDFNLLQTSIEPGETQVVEMPRMDVDGSTITDRSVRINSNRPIVAYQFNPLDFQSTYSDDSSLLLPAEMLDSEYLILSYPTSPLEAMPIIPMPSQHGYFTVIAVEEGITKVSVKLSAVADSPLEEGVLLEKGKIYEFTLNQGDVLNLQADGSKMFPIQDLSGSHVFADRKVAVFSGHEEAVVQPTELPGETIDCCCAEHLEEQLFPLSTWDSKYICAKARPRGGADRDLWRIQAGTGNVTITTNPPIDGLNGQTMAQKGDWVEAYTDQSFIVDATGPIQVAQYLVSGTCTDMSTGDPAMIMAVSSSQYRTNYVFSVPKDYTYDYITVVRQIGSPVTLDGVALSLAEFDPLTDGLFEIGYFEVDDGPHVIEGDDGFGLYQYGFSGPASYGNPGGLNLIKQQ